MTQSDSSKGLSPHFHLALSRHSSGQIVPKKACLLSLHPFRSRSVSVSEETGYKRIQKSCFHIKLETLFTDGQTETLNGLSGA